MNQQNYKFDIFSRSTKTKQFPKNFLEPQKNATDFQEFSRNSSITVSSGLREQPPLSPVHTLASPPVLGVSNKRLMYSQATSMQPWLL